MNDPTFSSAEQDPQPVNPDPHLGSEPSDDEKNMAIIAHASGIAGVFAGGLIGFVGPLVVYLMNKDRSPYVETQAKEALNFQITLLLFGAMLAASAIISCGLLMIFIWPLAMVPMICQVVFGVLATLTVKDGKFYRYPLTVRLLQ